jgi:competence protein ComEA
VKGGLRRALLAAFAAAGFMLDAAALELNTASQAELEQLRGIGVALSERLLAERAQRPFDDWADLRRRVPQVAGRRAEQLSQQGLRVADKPYAPAR